MNLLSAQRNNISTDIPLSLQHFCNSFSTFSRIYNYDVFCERINSNYGIRKSSLTGNANLTLISLFSYSNYCAYNFSFLIAFL